MEKPQLYHIAKITLLALLFFITPLVSPSIRPSYVYFLLNLLIIALGAEAGFLSFLTPQDEKKSTVFASKPIEITTRVITEVTPHKEVDAVKDISENVVELKEKKFEKSISEKVVSAVKVYNLKKCPSTPSIFFIGGEETDDEESDIEVEEDVEDCLSGQELFTKAEMFIGNFYNQLKIQREDSWRKIHDLYHKAF